MAAPFSPLNADTLWGLVSSVAYVFCSESKGTKKAELKYEIQLFIRNLYNDTFPHSLGIYVSTKSQNRFLFENQKIIHLHL